MLRLQGVNSEYKNVTEEKRTVSILQETEECKKAGGELRLHDKYGQYGAVDLQKITCVKSASNVFERELK